ncbi:hypothetical protein [Bradyrhizobium sp.]|uniref:hypothetical protein n=1 Tax=Bradyrhizobium sp. TaxID=376 RepID=UPI00262889F2|nr:hypothetical protein [Bradyrhizobium sp.]
MKDYLASIEKLRNDAAEAALISGLATDRPSAKCMLDFTGTSISLPMKSSKR